MIVDSSALVAILRQEPDADRFTEALARSSRSLLSAGTYLEVGIVADSSPDPVLGRRLDELLQALEIDIAPVTEQQAMVARRAYRDFGRGSGHPARLNYGDCFAYALAQTTGEPLLFTGDDFNLTDLRPALPPD
ncbi:type II toxin-antitoxin system VapC family toxin [Modestobacter lapidis]|nr:type II toxin-antitoxin system VapC family toxin [Modestobacter lapidis]